MHILDRSQAADCMLQALSCFRATFTRDVCLVVPSSMILWVRKRVRCALHSTHVVTLVRAGLARLLDFSLLDFSKTCIRHLDSQLALSLGVSPGCS